MENRLKYDTINDLSVWLRVGSNPADNNRFLSFTGKILECVSISSDTKLESCTVRRKLLIKYVY